MLLRVGESAPEFSLKDQYDTSHLLSEFLGEWVLLYFYPKDDTIGCTKEACSIRDNFPHFQSQKVKVIGISADSVQSHLAFSKKHQLPFLLLADERKEIVKQYGVWEEKIFLGKKYMGISRTSYLINPSGVIANIYEKVNPLTHAEEVLKDIRILRK